MGNNKITQEESSLEEALSPLVNRLIDKNYKTSQDKIAVQMAPLIGTAIRKQIQSQKDDVVDALYPVMGNMISRYVTKTLEDILNNINNQIHSGLSFKSLKRKITAKFKGISESELLFNENAIANIRALLLIHKETGIVLAHVENPSHPISEPEMLASMMTAIRSFVNDWIEQNNDEHELGEIEYGGNKIIIENSGYSYLAVIVQGSAYKATYDKIRQTLENIVLKYGDSIKKFNGDLEKFSNIDIYREISLLLGSHEEELIEKKKKTSLLFLLLPLILFFSSFYYYKSAVDEKLMNKIDNKLYKTPTLTSFRLHSSVDHGIVTLKGEVPFEYHKKLAQTTLNEIKEIQKIHNKIMVVNSLNDPVQTSSNIAYLLKGLNTQKGVNLTYSFNYDTLTLKGSVWSKTQKQNILEKFEKIDSINKINDEIEIKPPKINTVIYFKRDLAYLDVTEQTKLITLVTLLKQIRDSYGLTLTSYSDQIGTIEINKLLSKQRLANVSSFLKNQGQIINRLTLITKDTSPKDIDAKLEPSKARCIVISYDKGEDNASI